MDHASASFTSPWAVLSGHAITSTNSEHSFGHHHGLPMDLQYSYYRCDFFFFVNKKIFLHLFLMRHRRRLDFSLKTIKNATRWSEKLKFPSTAKVFSSPFANCCALHRHKKRATINSFDISFRWLILKNHVVIIDALIKDLKAQSNRKKSE